jgi:hypothetical protein
LDLGLLAAELLALCLLVFFAPRVVTFRLRRGFGYDDFVCFCQTNNISMTEFGALISVVLAFVFFDFFLAFTEEDPTEVFSVLFLALFLAGGFGLIFAFDLQYFYMVSSFGGANVIFEFFNDLIANFLCFLRVFLCWIRFIFYDLQVEGLDFVFHYLGDAGEVSFGVLGTSSQALFSSTALSFPSIWGAVWAPLAGLALVLLDL